MRKILQDSNPQRSSRDQDAWLDLATIATAELSSEDPNHPIENALAAGKASGFRASAPGPQHIRLTFDRPQAIRRIWLEFQEDSVARSQEFALFATSADGSRREVLRQQWSFSPGGSTEEVEDYTVDLPNVLTLELLVDPGRHDRSAFVTLKALRIA